MIQSYAEENYLKVIYHLSSDADSKISTNAIAKEIKTSPASVTDMMQKLSEKELVNYEKYKGTSLTNNGQKIALQVIRKHRLWECFLVEKLNFNWDEVHVIAEQLEHIKSPVLTNRLDEYLGKPKLDPHGDPIPDRHGKISKRDERLLSQMKIGDSAIIIAVKRDSSEFLKYLDTVGLSLGTRVFLKNFFDFDRSVQLVIDKKEISVSHTVAQNLIMEVERSKI